MKRNLEYEAGFVRRDVDHEPDDPLLVAARKKARKRLFVAGGAAAIAVVGAVAVAAVIHLRRETPATHLARGDTYAQKGHPLYAIIEYKQVLQVQPEQPAVRFRMATEMMKLGDVRNAEIEFQKALAGDYPRDEVTPGLVRSVLAQQKYAMVVSLVNDSSIESAETNAELQTMLGTAYLGLDKPDAAKGAFTAAKELVPNYSGALIAEGRALTARKDYAGAEALLATIPDRDPRQDEVQAMRGDIARAQGRSADAVAAYQASLGRNPQDIAVRISLTQCFVDLGQLDAARAQITPVLVEVPRSGPALFVATMVAYLQKDAKASHDLIARTLEVAPNDARAQLLAGAIAQQSGDLVKTELHLRQAVQLDPDNLQARFLTAQLAIERHELGKANDVLKPALDAFPGDQEIAALAARVALLQGDQPRAAKVLERAGVVKSGNADAEIKAAALRFAAGEPAAGLAQLDIAAQTDPANPEIDVARLLTRVQLRQLDAAQLAWKQLRDKQPDNPRTYNLQATIDRARGDMTAARRSMEKALALDPTYFLAISDLTVLDLREGKADAANRRLESYIAASPKSVEAIVLLAHVQEAAGAEPRAVLATLDRARQADPQSTVVIDERIAFQARHHDPAGQLAAAEDGLKVAPDNQAYLSTIADLSFRAADTDRAIALLRRLTTLGSENPDYAYRLGLAQLQKKDYEAALAAFRAALKIAPQRLEVQSATVRAFTAAGRTDEATRMLFEVSQASPASPLLGELGGDIKLAAKQFPEAIVQYRQALAANPSSILARKVGGTLLLAKQRTEASAFATEWLRTHPADSDMWLLDAQVALATREYKQAESDYRKALAIKPDQPDILNNLAWVLQQAGNPQAVVYAEKAHALEPGNADLTDTLGWILVQRGDTKRGVELIEKASAIAPQKLDIRLRLAKAQIKDGRRDDARNTLRALQTMAPSSEEARESTSLLATL